MCQLSLVNKTVIKHATNASNYKAAQNIQRRPGDCWKPWDAWGPSEKPEMEEEFRWWCIHSGQAIKSKNFHEWHHVSIASANSKSPHLLVNIQGTSSESLSEATSKTPPGQSFLVHIHPPALIHLIHWYMNLEPKSFGTFVAGTCMFSQKRTNGWIPYVLTYMISRMSFNVY